MGFAWSSSREDETVKGDEAKADPICKPPARSSRDSTRLKREFLSVETINLWLQCKVSPWMQLVHPLDLESIQLSLEHVQVLCQFLGCFYERLACWLRHLFFSLLAVYPRACPFNRYSARLDCGNKSGVILPGLVGVRLGEDSNGALEAIVSPQVA